jgi:hypothetical protein
MLKPFLHVSLSVLVALAATQIARAQYGGGMGGGMGGGGMGMGGMGGGMSSLPLSGGMGQSSSYGAFGNRTLGGGFNPAQGNFGGAGTAGGGAAAGLGLQNQQAAGQITGNERFLRQNQQPGQFVGSDSGEARNFIGAMTGLLGARNGMGMGNQQFGNNRNRNNQQNQNRNRNNRAERTPFKMSYVADFGPNQGAITPAAATKLGQQLSASKRLTAAGPIQVELQGETVILRGVVGSNHERDLAAQMAMLEPGVGAIQNDLRVAPPRAREPELPAPSNLRSRR